jgi:ABC-type Mn2+/Zn2+ transport system permease subunit
VSVGVLLMGSLIIVPAATAERLSNRPSPDVLAGYSRDIRQVSPGIRQA